MHTLEQLRAGQLVGARRLDLSAGLTEFPAEIFALADSLEVLNLSGNALTALPADLPRLRRLRVLFCSDNQFTTLPAVLGQCPRLSMVGFKANQLRALPAAALPPALRWLILTDNQLDSLPAELGSCRRLQKLMLAGNRLTELPATLAACTQLELLRIAANRFERLPAWLLTLPRLAWLAYAGNPCSDPLEAAAVAAHPAPTINWQDLTLGPPLGEGASGVIHRAEWAPAGAPPRAVAVKLFKGAVTSDGLPRSEMAAALSAGAAPYLLAGLGRVEGHPAGTAGLVLPLLDPALRNLAGPPSLATCTRDVYAAGTACDLAAALRLAHGIAAAGAHLHARGILHGDLYAHNILTTPAGDGRLSDFGAASFFDPAAPNAPALQRLEARAFALLLEELLLHCDASAASPDTFRALLDLQHRCAQPQVAARPLFAEIRAAVAGLREAVCAAPG